MLLIVGAGPVGLASALELARRGIELRIIDKAETPSKLSKAIGVNPRTLELLEPSGASATKAIATSPPLSSRRQRIATSTCWPCRRAAPKRSSPTRSRVMGSKWKGAVA